MCFLRGGLRHRLGREQHVVERAGGCVGLVGDAEFGIRAVGGKVSVPDEGVSAAFVCLFYPIDALQ